MDTGANEHFFRDKPTHNYQKRSGAVYTSNGGTAPVVGSGSINIGKLQLERVLHVPRFDRNLVSGSRLLDDGFTLVGEKKHINLSKDEKQICVAKLDPTDRLIKFAQNPFDVLGETYSSYQTSSISPVNAPRGDLGAPTSRLDVNVAHQI